MDAAAFFQEARELNHELERAFRSLEPYASSNRRAVEAREVVRQHGQQLRFALSANELNVQNLPDPFRVNEVCIQARQLAHKLAGNPASSTATTDLVDDLPNASERERMSLRDLWEQWVGPRRTRQPKSIGLAPKPALA